MRSGDGWGVWGVWGEEDSKGVKAKVLVLISVVGVLICSVAAAGKMPSKAGMILWGGFLGERQLVEEKLDVRERGVEDWDSGGGLWGWCDGRFLGDGDRDVVAERVGAWLTGRSPRGEAARNSRPGRRGLDDADGCFLGDTEEGVAEV